ncbi:MAG: bifunctional folylpolyglutamate synthase/dihydrofolate synthase [Epsilonproteobacteria bacterium]|nr:bifunctional folylpolyglutamate synthase/dihydrofolate synthase [Campylobacterota bacterium]
MKLGDYLAGKPLYYKEIDYTRMPKAWESIEKHFNLPKIIHILGTNGKGSTGRFLAHFLYKSGVKTGHYTSPHILQFNERIWIDGDDVSDEVLALNHQKLQTLLSQEFIDTLSYFEYTTFLAMLCFEGCEYIVLEAGLGGEYDATSVFGSDLTLVTPISIDHEAFLGDTIEAIAKTKLNAVRKFAILGKQEYKEVYKISKKLIRKKSLEVFRYDYFYITEEINEAKECIASLNLAPFLVDNLLLAMAGAKFFGFEVDFTKFSDLKLFGRCQKLSAHVTIDVGHNAAAATVLAKYFKSQKIILVYNSYADKDYQKILEILRPVIKRVEILPILNERVEQKDILVQTLEVLDITFDNFEKIESNEHYLVFGSFSVVEEFLKIYGEMLL